MKEHPILFSGEMVKAILEGRKTQTRRVMKKQPDRDGGIDACNSVYDHNITEFAPYQVGDHLWVKETWATEKRLDHLKISELGRAGELPVWFKGDVVNPLEPEPGKWRTSRFMFKSFARIWLEVVSVRAERVQDISNVDIQAEGVDGLHPLGGLYREQWRQRFRSLWDSINAKRGYGWDVNPWVWVIEFQPHPGFKSDKGEA